MHNSEYAKIGIMFANLVQSLATNGVTNYYENVFWP